MHIRCGILVVLTLLALRSGDVVAGTPIDPIPNKGEDANSVDFAIFDYPPLYHATEDGGFSGVLGETFKVLCETAGLNCRFRMLPVARAYKSLMEGESQVAISGKHPRFESCCVSTEWSYPWTSGIYSKKPLDEIPTTGDGLIGNSLIVLQGWIAPYAFQPKLDALVADGKISLFKASTNFSAIRMLESDRASFLYGATEFGWYFEKMGTMGSVNFRAIDTIPLVLWVSKDRPDVLKRLNQAFQKLTADGRLNTNNVLRWESLSARYVDAPFKSLR